MKALSAVAGVVFFFEQVSNYVSHYGLALGPLYRGQVELQPLLYDAFKTAILASIAGIAGVYADWKWNRKNLQNDRCKLER